MKNNTKTTTSTYRGRDGWVSETNSVAPVCNGKHLKIRTSKAPSGGISTTASCHAKEPSGGGFVTETHRVYRDLFVRVARNTNARCTEKSVETMHEAALSKLDELVAKAVAHYEALGEAA